MVVSAIRPDQHGATLRQLRGHAIVRVAVGVDGQSAGGHAALDGDLAASGDGGRQSDGDGPTSVVAQVLPASGRGVGRDNRAVDSAT